MRAEGTAHAKHNIQSKYNLHLTSHVNVDISNRKAVQTKLLATFDPCSGHVSVGEADGLGMRLQEENFLNDNRIFNQTCQHKYNL